MYFRKIITIKAEDSPNIRLALRELSLGKEPSNKNIVPGVLSYETYTQARKIWDTASQCIGLDGEFYEGAEVLLFPIEWLNQSSRKADELGNWLLNSTAEAIGVDAAEGGDNTAIAVVGRKGLLKLISKKTPDTNKIIGEVIATAQEYRVPWDRVIFDRGGGGKQHADRMRAMGYNVRTVAFGEAITADPRSATIIGIKKRIEEREVRYTFKNRRALLFWDLRKLIDPVNKEIFAIPARYAELKRQLSLIPLTYDEEGRLFLIPKGSTLGDTHKKSLISIMGHSPDEADAVVLGVYGMLYSAIYAVAGAL